MGESLLMCLSGSHCSLRMCSPWTTQGSALRNCSKIDNPGHCGLWAPDVNFVDGKYVMYYAASNGSGSQDSAIGVATSPTMENGTWDDLGQVISSKHGDAYNASK